MPYSSSASIVIEGPRTKIWDALTRPELIKQYFFGTNLVTDWTVGSPLFFRGEWSGKSYEDKGTVLSFDPMIGLSFNYWSAFSGLDDRPELRSIIRYTIDEIPDGSRKRARITVDQSNVDTQERAEHSAKNWQAVLDGLKKLVEAASNA